jgi:tRNA (guanine-N7-)-methyltransferase
VTDTTSPTPPAALPAALPEGTPDTPAVPGTPADTAHHRNIRSFVRRTGRTTLGQAKAFTDVGPQFLLPYAAAPADFEAIFQRRLRPSWR